MNPTSHKVLSLSLYLINTLAQLALLLLSGWFIAACALAGQAGVLAGFNYVIPATLIRFLAIIRIASGYFEKYSSHLLLLRKLQSLRHQLLTQVFARRLTLQQNETAKTLQQTSEQLAASWSSVTSPIATALTLVVIFSGVIGFFFPSALWWWALFVMTFTLTLLAFKQLHLRACRDEEARQQTYLNQQRQWLYTSTLWHLSGDHFHADTLKSLAIETSAARLRVERLESLADVTMAVISLVFASGVFWSLNILAQPSSWLILAFIFLATREWGTPVFQAIFAHHRREPINTEPNGITSAGATSSEVNVIYNLSLVDFRWHREHSFGKSVSAEFNGTGLYWFKAPSGVGKSSLFDALIGELDSTGQIRLNQSACDAKTMLEHSHYAQQQDHIFAGTLAENLRMVQPKSMDAALLNALSWAELNQWQQAKDLNIWLGDQGLPISGGEIKRLQLARARLSGKPIWLLDEPFEGLDANTLGKLCQKLNEERQQRLIILASHLLPKELIVDGEFGFSPETASPPADKSTQTSQQSHHQS